MKYEVKPNGDATWFDVILPDRRIAASFGVRTHPDARGAAERECRALNGEVSGEVAVFAAKLRAELLERHAKCESAIFGNGIMRAVACLDSLLPAPSPPPAATRAEPTIATAFTFDALRTANATRADEWTGTQDAEIEFAACELAGEDGEVCNAAKKIARHRMGMKGGVESLDNLREELGDVIISCDLLARKVGIDLGAAVVAKFNATSTKHGFKTMLTTAAKGETPFAEYQRTQIAELRPYVPGESMNGISVSVHDSKAGSPKVGDMIARNPKSHADQWLVAAAYFAENFSAKHAPPAPREPDARLKAMDMNMNEIINALGMTGDPLMYDILERIKSLRDSADAVAMLEEMATTGQPAIQRRGYWAVNNGDDMWYSHDDDSLLSAIRAAYSAYSTWQARQTPPEKAPTLAERVRAELERQRHDTELRHVNWDGIKPLTDEACKIARESDVMCRHHNGDWMLLPRSVTLHRAEIATAKQENH